MRFYFFLPFGHPNGMKKINERRINEKCHLACLKAHMLLLLAAQQLTISTISLYWHYMNYISS